MSLINNIHADIDLFLSHSSSYGDGGHYGAFSRLSALLTPSLLCCLSYRTSHALYLNRWYALSNFIYTLTKMFFGCSLHPQSVIAGGLYIPHPHTSIVFEGIAGRNLHLFAAATVICKKGSVQNKITPENSPQLKDDVKIGYKAVVEGPVQIGRNCQIGPMAVVKKSIRDNCSVVSRQMKMRYVK